MSNVDLVGDYLIKNLGPNWKDVLRLSFALGDGATIPKISIEKVTERKNAIKDDMTAREYEVMRKVHKRALPSIKREFTEALGDNPLEGTALGSFAAAAQSEDGEGMDFSQLLGPMLGGTNQKELQNQISADTQKVMEKDKELTAVCTLMAYPEDLFSDLWIPIRTALDE